MSAPDLAGLDELHDLLATITAFGLRNPGSVNHERLLDWVEAQFGQLPGVTIDVRRFELTRWQPLDAAGEPGDLLGAAALEVTGHGAVAVAGAVPYSRPTGPTCGRGELVVLAPDEAITRDNAAGKVVVRAVTYADIPWFYVHLLALHVTADIPFRGGYGRPFTAPLDAELTAAGQAGAAGVVFVFDVPCEQVAGYFDPHEGTLHHVPAVFVGRNEGVALRRAAARGGSAQLTVRASVERVVTRNVHATLAGRSRERIVLNTHSDGATWVQENGVAGLLVLARRLAGLPAVERPRDIEFAITSSHLNYAFDGNQLLADDLDADMDRGRVAYVMAVEHLGTREIVPDRAGRLTDSGGGEPMFWNVGPSKALRRATIDAVRRHRLDRTLVVPGSGPPVKGRIPEFNYMGGIGSFTHVSLVPTIGIISGPWTLWAPAFGENAVDFHRMRSQLLAILDVVMNTMGLPIEELHGDYPAMRRAVANGAPRAPRVLNPPAIARLTDAAGVAVDSAPHTELSTTFGRRRSRPSAPLQMVLAGLARTGLRLAIRRWTRG